MTIEPVPSVGPEVTAWQQRTDLLETIDVTYMQSAAAYDFEDDIARKKRQTFEHALPQGLSVEELKKLAQRVGSIHADENRIDTATSARFLYWLGDSSQAYDTAAAKTTARNVEKVLMQDLGIRGKLGALSLMKLRIFSF